MASLKSAMIKGCREPPYPSILTDATMEKLALAKFVAQESKCEVRAGGGGGYCGVGGRAVQTDVSRTSPSPPGEGPVPRPTWAMALFSQRPFLGLSHR